MHWPVVFHVAAAAPPGMLQPAKRRGMAWNRCGESHRPPIIGTTLQAGECLSIRGGLSLSIWSALISDF